MPHLTFANSKDGYALTVVVGLNGHDSTKLVTQGMPVTPPLVVRALIDSANDVTCVAAGVLRHFGLSLIGRVTTQTMAESVFANLFEVSLGIPKSGGLTGPLLVLEQLRVMEWIQVFPNVDVMLGKDVLSHCLLIIDGPRAKFTLSD